TADRLAVMYAGQVVETGTTPDLFAAPHHPYTRGLLDCIPTPGRRRLGSIPGLVPSLIGDMSGCLFRNRCGLAQDACFGDIPVRELNRGHDYRCVMDPAEVFAHVRRHSMAEPAS